MREKLTFCLCDWFCRKRLKPSVQTHVNSDEGADVAGSSQGHTAAEGRDHPDSTRWPYIVDAARTRQSWQVYPPVLVPAPAQPDFRESLTPNGVRSTEFRIRRPVSGYLALLPVNPMRLDTLAYTITHATQPKPTMSLDTSIPGTGVFSVVPAPKKPKRTRASASKVRTGCLTWFVTTLMPL